MYYKLIGCKIFEREIASVAYNCKNTLDVTLMRQRLHNTPELLKAALQEELDLIDENRHRFSNDTTIRDYDAVLIAYGLCANVIAGLKSRKYPLVIPWAHDCVTLVMGSKDVYASYHKGYPGSFYYWPGAMDLREIDDGDNYARRYQMYLDRYEGDEERAQMIMEIEAGMTVNYDGLTYISWQELSFPEYEASARKHADEKGWEFRAFEGNNRLLRKLVDGDWDKEDFLVLRPGHSARPTYDNDIIREDV